MRIVFLIFLSVSVFQIISIHFYHVPVFIAEVAHIPFRIFHEQFKRHDNLESRYRDQQTQRNEHLQN